MAEKVKDSIDVKASAEELFAVATDFATYPDWSPNIKEARVEETDDEGLPTKVWFRVDAKIRELSYTLDYDYADAPESFSWKLADGDVKDLEGSYTFDEFDDVTEVRYELRIDPGFPVPGFLKKQAEKQVVRAALQDLKKRVESG
jgi:ribosome-associated toxin RatA of RatAB toxin-antitoxin module